ncbi:MAG: flavodoxin family protein [Actinobacteria bacterium]|nr:flavodoxin family protein [Actinomycetota bacterium]
MTRVLVVHHTVSPATQELLEVSLAGCQAAAVGLEVDLDLVTVAALGAGAHDVLAADAVLLGTPANIGYLSGAMKHFFDQIYYPCLEQTQGLPFGAYLHGNDDTVGAQRALSKITTGLGWSAVRPAVSIAGEPDALAREQLTDLAGLVVSAAAAN